MPIESRPNLRGLSDEQRGLALAHWHVWLAAELHDWLLVSYEGILFHLEFDMQPETLHRLALARGSYFREVAANATMQKD